VFCECERVDTLWRLATILWAASCTTANNTKGTNTGGTPTATQREIGEEGGGRRGQGWTRGETEGEEAPKARVKKDKTCPLQGDGLRIAIVLKAVRVRVWSYPA
jgi:hypothetical protein